MTCEDSLIAATALFHGHTLAPPCGGSHIPKLSEQLRDHLATIDGSTFIPAIVKVGQPGMVKAEKMKNRGVDVMHVAAAFHCP